ncbi:MAG: SDR family oxidoreductase [Anaerolineales bacterium]|nr:SDR family oxidoreductase [Anaerolineales bacterium]
MFSRNRRFRVIGLERIALVTGGSSGIGLALARELAQVGCHVWLVARDRDRLASALAEVMSLRLNENQHCGVISADVSDQAQAAAAVERVSNEVGVPHLLINSAGEAQPGYFHELDLESFHWMMDENYFGTVNMIKAVLPGMMARGSGHIVNISSVAGFLGVFGYSAYSASKFAVSGFSDVLRAETKPNGIGVSVVFPSDVDTPQLAYESQFRPAETRALVSGGPIMSPEVVARIILRGVSRGKYVILPGLTAKVLYWLTKGLGNVAYPVMDWIVARAQRQVK